MCDLGRPSLLTAAVRTPIMMLDFWSPLTSQPENLPVGASELARFICTGPTQAAVAVTAPCGAVLVSSVAVTSGTLECKELPNSGAFKEPASGSLSLVAGLGPGPL